MQALIIGQLNGHASSLAKILKQNSLHLIQVSNLDEAKTWKKKDVEVVFFDNENYIRHLLAIAPKLIACGEGKSTSFVEKVIKAGAHHFLPLPPDFQITSLLLQNENNNQRKMMFQSAKMAKIIDMARKVAPSKAPVLITGESGTGKELLARFIHEHSLRKDSPFVSVNCAAIPEKLLESELFGYEKGAFTGATTRRIGIFEKADGGTLLLDEISEMDIHLQAKILRVIQEKEVVRVGGNAPIKIDIKIVATCNVNLQEMAIADKFRQDLFFRLSVIQIEIPPLRDHKRDIELLADYFSSYFCKENGISAKTISKDAMKKLLDHTWNGNIRELENCIHRSVLLEDGNSITGEYFDLQSMKLPKSDTKNQTIRQIEKSATLSTLENCKGNRTKTAQILGISIRTLRNKLNQYSKEQ